MHILKRISVIMLCCTAVLAAAFLHVQPIEAEASEPVTVRVGYFSNGDFMRKQDDGSYEGYDVEYYYMLAQYANWNIEFVDFSSLTAAENGLENGEIDILSGLSKNATRESKFLFAAAKMCTTRTAVQTRKDDDRFSLNDISSMKDMTCGILKNSVINSLYTSWCADRGLTAHIVAYDNVDERNSAFAAGAVDAIAAGSTVEGAQKIAEFPSFDIYFVLNKSNSALKQQLDSAMSVLSLENANFEETLMEKYFPATRNTTPSFSKTEKAYILQHSVLSVGLLEDDEPYSYLSSGQMLGFLPEFYAKLSTLTGIQFKCFAYKDVDSMYDALNSGDIDIIGKSEKDAYAAVGRQVAQSNTFLSADLVQLQYSGTSKISKAAVPRCNEKMAEDILQKAGSDIELTVYDNNAQCMEAVKKKTVDAAYISRPAANYYLDRTRASDYVTTTFGTDPWQVAMSVSLGAEGTTLRSILNKTLNVQGLSIDELISEDLIKDNASLRTFLNQLPSSTIVSLAIGSSGISIIIIIALIIILRRRKTEKELAVQQAKVSSEQEMNKARHAFFGAVSHDMRTPLNGIVGFTDLAMQSDNIEDVKSYLSKIHSSGETLSQLVNDTLLMSRIEDDRYVLHPSPTDLADLMQAVTIPIEEIAEESHITFKNDTAQACTGCYSIDRLSVQKIFMNLLTNAIKFTHPGGNVTFTARKENDQFIFTVSDDGIGIDENFKAHIFEPFSQEDTTNTKVSGTGLGLSIVKNIVDAMNGEINVDSKKGEGTTFTVKLKFEECSCPGYKEEKASLVSTDCLRHKHILVCEDNELNMEIETSILKKAKMEVTEAMDGKQGLDLFAQSPEGFYDAILMDLRMPVMDGLTAARKIRELSRDDASKVLIFAVSADAYQENVAEAQEAGMNGHIAKPISAEELLQTLAKSMQQ